MTHIATMPSPCSACSTPAACEENGRCLLPAVKGHVTATAENPKDALARELDKVPLDLLEPVAERAIARALAFGAKKYGVRNYVTAPINARVYVAAMKRHIDAWLEGEDNADDSGVHHLGHIGANVHVALAAIAAGSFVDDRHAGHSSDSDDQPARR